MADEDPPAMSDMVASHAVKGDAVKNNTSQHNTTQNSTNEDESATITKLSSMKLDNMIDNGHAPITKLADELILLITRELTNIDLKSLRLASKVFASKVVLSYHRVLVAMNKFDLEVLRDVAERPELARQVKELVWVNVHFVDHAITDPFGRGEGERNFEQPFEIPHGESYGFPPSAEQGFPDSYYQIARQNSVERDEKYERLCSEKKAIVSSEEHIMVLGDALPRLESLKRVTIQEQCYFHNWTAEVTAFRAFRALDHSLPMHPWSRTSNNLYHYGSVIRELGASTCSVKELIIEKDAEILKGIPYGCFENKVISKHMKSIGGRGLERLDLAIDITSIDDVELGLISLSGNDLHDILSGATSLKHFEFRTNWLRFNRPDPDESYRHALKAVPTKSFWPELKHLTLSNMPVASDDLLALVENLSSSIVYLECDHLAMHDCTWPHLLPQLKARLPYTNDMLTVKVDHDKENQVPHRLIPANEEIRGVSITIQRVGYRTYPEVYSFEYY